MNRENSTKEIAAVKEQIQLEAWRREAEAQRASGLSVKAWCARNGVSQSGYYHRLRRLREAVCQQISSGQEMMQPPAQPAVVPIRTAEAVQCRAGSTEIAPVIEVKTGNLHIRLSADCPAELVCAMLRDLRS